jgi:hypothetical protein
MRVRLLRFLVICHILGPINIEDISRIELELSSLESRNRRLRLSAFKFQDKGKLHVWVTYKFQKWTTNRR